MGLEHTPNLKMTFKKSLGKRGKPLRIVSGIGKKPVRNWE